MRNQEQICKPVNLFKLYILGVSICCAVVYIQQCILRFKQINEFIPFMIYEGISDPTCRQYNGISYVILANQTNIKQGFNQTFLFSNCSNSSIGFTQIINDTCSVGGINLPDEARNKTITYFKQKVIPYVILAIVFTSLSALLTLFSTINEFVHLPVISCHCCTEGIPTAQHQQFVFFIYLFLDCLMAPFTVALATDLYPECISYKTRIQALDPMSGAIYGLSQIVFIFCVGRLCQTPLFFCLIWLLLMFDCFILLYVSYFQPLWLFIMLMIKVSLEIFILCASAIGNRNHTQPGAASNPAPHLAPDQNSQNILV